MSEQAWSEAMSRAFIDYGRFFVPARETQLWLLAELLPADAPLRVVELACGAGLLAEAILRRHPQARLIGLDGSAAMRAAAAARLAPFGGRFEVRPFDLFAADWRQMRGADAVVSSLTIHHLDDAGKRQLYADLFAMLAPGGVLLIADLVQPAGAAGTAVAARAWDDAVRQHGEAAFAAFEQAQWNLYRHPDPMDRPSRLFDQLRWLAAAGFGEVDVFWMQAGHAIFGGRRLAS